MAEIVLGIGTSHTPLLTFEAGQWADYATRDRRERKLNLADGRWLFYDELIAERGEPHGAVAVEAEFRRKAAACQAALDRLAGEIAAAAPDVVVIITDDESELFSRANTPAVAIYYGPEILTHPRARAEMPPEWVAPMLKTYGMDKVHAFPAQPEFARELIERLIDKGIDIGAAASVEDPERAGFGHGVGFVVNRLFGGKRIPVIPVLLNTYFPPNTPTPARCYAIGEALGAAIRESPAALRVIVLASGGLSHFLVEEALDRRVIEGLCGSPETLRTLPVPALNSGSSEIRNWIALGGAIAGMKNRWIEYQPLIRTPAGTGIGVAFGAWG